MHECLLCERDMKKSRDTFGRGCINNILKFLDIKKSIKGKNKEQFLYKKIIKLTGNPKINDKQKVWLTDRYLTYKYLDKLYYGNFESLKNQINSDIINIEKAEKIEDLKTIQKIRLKEAYDLYKKENKFKSAINKVKTDNIHKEKEKIKLLISASSYIFNMYKNKSQYKKDSFKAMQYAFWQTVIEVGGRYFNYELAAKLLQHSLEKNPQTFLISDEKIIEMIINDPNFKSKIKEIINKNNKNFKFKKFNQKLEIEAYDNFMSRNYQEYISSK